MSTDTSKSSHAEMEKKIKELDAKIDELEKKKQKVIMWKFYWCYISVFTFIISFKIYFIFPVQQQLWSLYTVHL